MPENRPFLPLSHTLTILPLGELGISLSGTFLDQVGVEYLQFDLDESSGILTVDTVLVFAKEVSLQFPGVEDFALVLGPDEGLSSFPFLLKVGNEFLISITDLRSLLRIPASILVKAKHPEGSTDVNEWIPDTESPYEIILPALSLSLDHDFNFDIDGTPSLSLTPAFIGDTGLIFEADNIQLFFDASASPPTGRPAGFKGLYIESARLYLPPDFVLGDVIISLSQAGVGNGGVFGAVALTWDNRLIEEPDEGQPHVEGAATGSFLDVPFALKEIALTLDQNVPTEAALKAELLLPFFNKAMSLAISIETDGNFSFTLGAGGTSSNSNLVQFDLPHLLQVTVESFTGEKKDDIGIFSIKGKLKPLLGEMDWPSFDINKLSIDTDGNVDFDGGWVNLPTAFTLDFNAFKIGISQFGFGTEGEDPEPQRQWIGLSGELTLVEGLDIKASVEGLKFSWLKEPKPDGDRALQVSLTGVAVEFEIPNTLSFEGSVSYKKFDEPDPQTGLTGDLFKGNIKLNLMAVRLQIEAELMIGKLKDADGNEFTTFFIVLGAELPAGLPLGATGTSLYGIKGLCAIHAGPTKTEEQNWYEWYQSPPARNITSIRKWMPIYDNYGFGAGVTIGTMFDDGFTINMSVMLVVLVPGPVIILEGKANLLKQRSDNKDEEGAFYLLAVLDGRAGTFMLNIDVRYSLEDVITIGAGLEAFFDFNNSENWYIYIGRDEPESKRIRAEILSLFKASAYFMIDSKSLKTGASVGLDIREQYGPISFALVAKISFDAAIFWKPLQLEGQLELEAELSLKIFGIGLELFMYMLLGGKVPEPYRIYGVARIGIKLFWPLPDLTLEVEFEWVQPGETKPVWPLLKECSFIHHKGNGTTWPMTLAGEAPPDWADFPVVPVDSRPVLTFARPVHNLKRHESSGLQLPLLALQYDEVGGNQFTYNIHDDKIELQAYIENSWETVKTGINTGADDEFTISKKNIINLQDNIEPNEPQIQLWRQHVGDTEDQYRREDYNDRHSACNPKTTQHWFIVNWKTVNKGTTYDYNFHYAGLNFVANEFGSHRPPRATGHYLFTPDFSIHFPDPVYQFAIYFAQETSLATGTASYKGNKVADLERHGRSLLIRGLQKIDSVRISGRTLMVQEIRYMTVKSVIEQAADTSSRHANETEQNVNGKLNLLPATYYRLRIETSVDVDENAAVKHTTDYVYFRTDDGPGIPEVPEFIGAGDLPKPLTHKEKAINLLPTYIERTLPLDGALNFYYSYDIGVQFNESYVREMYPKGIQMRFKDRNGEYLDDSEGSFIDGFLPLMPFGLLSWLMNKEAGDCERGDQPETAAPFLNFSTSKQFKANALYTAEMITNTELGTQLLHQFQFTTSRYATFEQHILSGYSDEVINAIELPAVAIRAETDLQPLIDTNRAVITQENQFEGTVGALDKYRVTEVLEAAFAERFYQNTQTFNELEATANRAFAKLGMSDRPLPEHFEVFRIAIKSTDKVLLLLESPEPIQWERVRIKASQVNDRRWKKMCNVVWNKDQTRGFLYHKDGHLFPNGEFKFLFNFSGEANAITGVVLQDGAVVNEPVRFTLT